MKSNVIVAAVLIAFLWLWHLLTLVEPGGAELLRGIQGRESLSFNETIASIKTVNETLTAACQTGEHLQAANSLAQEASGSKQRAPRYQPRQLLALAHPTNYGERFVQDVSGRSVSNKPIVVLHETVGSTAGTISLFQTPHPRDEDQISYHTLIALDGTVIYIVPPDKRAFGAGNSVFRSQSGLEAVQTNPKFPPSVNNFAYHISLETPPGGIHNGSSHSGYTNAQYQSLGWLVAKTGVADNRITTHKAVDKSRSRRDPRSFNVRKFQKILNSYPRVDQIGLGCGVEPSESPGEQHLLPPADTTGNSIGR